MTAMAPQFAYMYPEQKTSAWQ